MSLSLSHTPSLHNCTLPTPISLCNNPTVKSEGCAYIWTHLQLKHLIGQHRLRQKLVDDPIAQWVVTATIKWGCNLSYAVTMANRLSLLLSFSLSLSLLLALCLSSSIVWLWPWAHKSRFSLKRHWL